MGIYVPVSVCVSKYTMKSTCKCIHSHVPVYCETRYVCVGVC